MVTKTAKHCKKKSGNSVGIQKTVGIDFPLFICFVNNIYSPKQYTLLFFI